MANPALCMEDEAASQKELAEYRAAGGTAVVDAQPVFCGRMAGALQRASLASGVHIIAVTGFHKTAFYKKDSPVFACGTKQLAEIFAADVTAGMLDTDGRRTDAKAGLIKIALDNNGDESMYRKLTEASLIAASVTGAPILVHTEPGVDVLGLLAKAKEKGIPAERVIICHLCRTRYDFEYHKAVLEQGAFLCYDSVNRTKYISHSQMIGLVLEMVRAGHGAQVLLGLDTTNQRLRAYGADMGLDYILTTFKPTLLQAGLPEEAFRQITTHNPALALRMTCK